MSRILTKSGKEYPDWKLQPPPEGAPGVGPWVWATYEKLRRHRDKTGLVELWAHFHELYRGRIFKRKVKFAQVVANLFFKVINTLVANLTDNKPRASIMPNGETPDDIADGWQACYDTWWDQNQQQRCLAVSVKRSELYGYQCDEMRFNPDLEGGLGDIETHRIDTYGVLFWPGHIDIQTQPAMITYEAMELGEIYDRWPEAKGKVEADPSFSELLKEDRAFVRATQSKNLRPEGQATGYVIPGSDIGLGGSYTPESSAGIQRALIVRCWVKDYSMQWVDPRNGEPCGKNAVLTEPVVDPATGQPFTDPETGQPVMQVIQPEQWSKYPGYIRCVVVTNKGQLVLDDLPNPSINPDIPRIVASECYLWDKFPFIKRFSYSDDISEYGLSIVEQIETLVIEVCKKLTQYGAHLDTLCRNPLILPQGCGVKKNDVNNLPRRVWEPVAGMAGAIRFLEVPSAPADIITYIELCIKLVDMITGITDVSEGRKPTGITAAHAIAALQEKAQTVYREKIRNNDLYLEEQGRMFISLGQNWYTEERRLRYEGKQGQSMIDFRGVAAQGELAFHIEAGSTLPRNRQVRQMQIIELAKGKPTFPNSVLLKELGIPNHDEVAAQMDAGPMGMAMQKLARSKLFDPETLQAIENVVKMPDKDFRKNFGPDNPLDIAGENR